jgi:beta-glucanase (GH16 family)
MKNRTILAYVFSLFIILFSISEFFNVRCSAASVEDTSNYFSDFDIYNIIEFKKSEKVSGQSPDVKWLKKNVVFQDGEMIITMNNTPSGIEGGEIRVNRLFSYGLYQVSMKPVKHSGVVSSFFNYANWGETGTEIDIEFLGYDTTKVQFNYYTNGVGKHEYLYDLGFDASEEYHTYAFYWTSDSISWFVDGELVHEAHENIPQRPACIYMDVWGGVDPEWMGEYDGSSNLNAYYDWISYTSIGDMGTN